MEQVTEAKYCDDYKFFEWVSGSGQQLEFRHIVFSPEMTLSLYGYREPWKVRDLYVWCEEFVLDTVRRGLDLLRKCPEYFFLRPNETTSIPVYVKEADKTVRFRSVWQGDDKYLLAVVVAGRRFSIDAETGW